MDSADRDEDRPAIIKPSATPEKLAKFHAMLTEVCNAPFVMGDETCANIIAAMTRLADNPEMVAVLMEELYDRVRVMAEERYGPAIIGKTRRGPDFRGNLNDEDDGAWRMMLRL